MDCQAIAFSSTKSRQRIARVSQVFNSYLLNRILAFALYLLGAKKRVVASLFQIPEDSLKTMLRTLQRDGFPALQDRRQTATPLISPTSSQKPSPPRVSLLVDDEFCWICFGFQAHELKIPRHHKVHLRTVLVSLFQAGLLTSGEISSVLGITAARCRALADQLASHGVEKALVDKRKGQKKDFRVADKEKKAIVKHYVATLLTGRPSASASLAKAIEKHDAISLSPRTIRWHVNKLGLQNLKTTLPSLIETLKKTTESSG